MRKVKTKTKLISVSAKCFSLILTLIFAIPCYALNVSGVPDWLEAAVSRSLNAVWDEIPKTPDVDREGTLILVASRLFAGYDVKIIKNERDEPVVFFAAKNKYKDENEKNSYEIKIVVPELRGMVLKWFENDISGVNEEIHSLVENLPQDALTWADEALREKLVSVFSEKLPGWDFSQQIFISQNSTLINLTFRPSSKMILAIKPSLYSRSIPVMFRSDLEAKLIPEFSPLIGVPVKWAEKHKKDIEKIAGEFLEDRHSVENLKAEVSVNFTSDTISNLEAAVDSKNFMFQMWVAAYAGLEDRYPEIGLFFGFRPRLKFNPEIYTEIIFELNDFEGTYRLGGRFEVLNNFWLGIENQWPENEFFFRVQYSPVKIRRPYASWRYSPKLDVHEASFGYKIDEHVSVEIYYDSSGAKSKKFGLRGMWQL